MTGDVYALCGDSKIHVLRPSAALIRHHPAHSSGAFSAFTEEETYAEAVQPATYSDPSMLISNFYIRLSLSPDGRYLAAGSCKGGLMTWDTQERGQDMNERRGASRTVAKKLGMGVEVRMSGVGEKDREVCAVEWGKDIVSLLFFSLFSFCPPTLLLFLFLLYYIWKTDNLLFLKKNLAGGNIRRIFDTDMEVRTRDCKANSREPWCLRR